MNQLYERRLLIDMYRLFLNYLINKIEKDIDRKHRDVRNMKYKVKLMRTVKIFGGYHGTFRIVDFSNRIKIKENLKIDEKLIIKDANGFSIGTLMSIDDDHINISLQDNLYEGKYTITRHVNFNNFVLLKELKTLMISEDINNYVIKEIFKTLVYKLKPIIEKDSIQKDLNDFIFLYIFLSKMIYESETNILLDELLNNSCMSKNVKKQIKITFVKKYNDFRNQKIDNTIDRVNEYTLDSIYDDCYFDLEQELLSVDLQSNKLNFYNNSLNESQKSAVRCIGKEVCFKIIGPPGTGKTSTINEIILQLLKTGAKILVCGPSNTSIDNLILKYLESDITAKPPIKFYRRGNNYKGLFKYNLIRLIEEKVTDYLKTNCMDFDSCNVENLIQIYKEQIESETKLVFSTTFSALNELYGFDWVIIDEACQSSIVESYLSIRHGKKFILVGDPNQLCHDFSFLFEMLSLKTFLLDTQYRMCHKLISFSNTSFYKNQIKSFKKESFSIIENSPIVFVDTKTIDALESNVKTSKANQKEAELLVLLESLIQSKDIGIITPYCAQVKLIKKLLRKLEVATVDGFQGREKEFIMISLVRSNPYGNFGFLDDFRRLNVALSRCQKGLIVVGNSDCFRKCDVVNNFIKFVEKNFVSIDPFSIKSYIR